MGLRFLPRSESIKLLSQQRILPVLNVRCEQYIRLWIPHVLNLNCVSVPISLPREVRDLCVKPAVLACS
jgi:hypothetical protein